MPIPVILLAMFVGGYLGIFIAKAKKDRSRLDKIFAIICVIFLVFYYIFVFSLI